MFITNRSELLYPTRISEIVRRAADRAGIQEVYDETADGHPKRRITAHSLRSTFIVRLLESHSGPDDEDLTMPKIMELSGHKKLETVESYVKMLNEDAISAYRDAQIDFGTD